MRNKLLKIAALLALPLMVVAIIVTPQTSSAMPLDNNPNQPQTAEWFNWIVENNEAMDAISILGSHWDATVTCNPTGTCVPTFGGEFTSENCTTTPLKKGTVLWGGYFNPEERIPGFESLTNEGWVHVLRAIEDGAKLTDTCVGGRFLEEINTHLMLPVIYR